MDIKRQCLCWAIILLSGCAYNPTQDYYSPYPDVSEAEQYVTWREELGYWELQEACGLRKRVLGCSNGNAILLFKGLSKESKRDVYLHELAHVYEERILNITNPDHNGWKEE